MEEEDTVITSPPPNTLATRLFFFASELQHSFRQPLDGNIAILGRGELHAVPSGEHIMVDAADAKIPVPQAHGDARPQDCGNLGRLRRCEHRGRV